MPLALVTIVSGGGGAAALRFGAPAIVGQDNYATGFRGFGEGAHALGKAGGGWYGTSDGEKSWGKVLDGGRDIEGDVHAAVLSSDGWTMHNLGAVAVVADWRTSSAPTTPSTPPRPSTFRCRRTCHSPSQPPRARRPSFLRLAATRYLRRPEVARAI